jgi:hypothetical protein
MPKRSSNGKNVNRVAYGVVAAAKGEHRKNPAAVALGRLGGKKGGHARAHTLTPERRREIAVKAAKARWQDQPAARELKRIFEEHLDQFSPEEQKTMVRAALAIPVRDKKSEPRASRSRTVRPRDRT